MRDIVERLKDSADQHPLDAPMDLFTEAADEIERLKRELLAVQSLDESFDRMLDDHLVRQKEKPTEHNAGWIDALEHVLGMMRLRALALPTDGATFNSTKVRTLP